ncbi:hypothetical protein EDB87DRAFT_680579 [Lactarius vividus]|nr:hypothetical protein EDB87DRAFT_680579 [Lactarius vividus]
MAISCVNYWGTQCRRPLLQNCSHIFFFFFRSGHHPAQAPRTRPERQEPQHALVHGPVAHPSATAVLGFSLASPRPGGGRPGNELLGSTTFQTPEADASTSSLRTFIIKNLRWIFLGRDSHCLYRRQFQGGTQCHRAMVQDSFRCRAQSQSLQSFTTFYSKQIRFFITVLQQMARAGPMTALLSPAVRVPCRARWRLSLQVRLPNLPDSSLPCPVPHPPAPSTLAPQTASRLALTRLLFSSLLIPPILLAT